MERENEGKKEKEVRKQTRKYLVPTEENGRCDR